MGGSHHPQFLKGMVPMATFPTTPEGGPISKVVRVSKANRTKGGVAIPAFGYRANAVPSDARILGGPSGNVIIITTGDLVENGGSYELRGDVRAWPIMDDPTPNTSSVEGDNADVVLIVNPAQYP